MPWYYMSCQFCAAFVRLLCGNLSHRSLLPTHCPLFHRAKHPSPSPLFHLPNHLMHHLFLDGRHLFNVISKVEYCSQNCLPFQVLNMDAKTKASVGQKSYEIKDKRNVVQQVDELVSTGFTCHKACLSLGIPLLYYSR